MTAPCSEIQVQYYPSSDPIPPLLTDIVNAFRQSAADIKRSKQKKSNDILAIVAASLEKLGFTVERPGKPAHTETVTDHKTGHPLKTIRPDAINFTSNTVIEVEAGGTIQNNKIYKDIFQACMIPNIHYLVIATPIVYSSKKNGQAVNQKTFEGANKSLNAIYSHASPQEALKGVLLIGY